MVAVLGLDPLVVVSQDIAASGHCFVPCTNMLTAA